MKKFLILTILSVFIGLNTINAQIINPIKWEYSVKKIDKKNVELTITASIQEKWHLYGQYSEPAGGIPLSFSIEKSDNYEIVEKFVAQQKPHKEYDDIMQANVQYFEKTVSFTQKVILKTKKDFVIEGTLEGQACSTEGLCIPLSEKFKIIIK